MGHHVDLPQRGPRALRERRQVAPHWALLAVAGQAVGGDDADDRAVEGVEHPALGHDIGAVRVVSS